MNAVLELLHVPEMWKQQKEADLYWPASFCCFFISS